MKSKIVRFMGGQSTMVDERVEGRGKRRDIDQNVHSFSYARRISS